MDVRRKTRRRSRLAVLASALMMALGLVLVGCSSSSSAGGAAAGGSGAGSVAMPTEQAAPSGAATQGSVGSGLPDMMGKTPPVATTGKKYSIVLVNSLLSNAWRPLMEKYAQIFSQTGPLSSRVASLKVVNTDNTPQAANAALQTVILSKPDIVLIDAQSPTAENAAIQQGCSQGIEMVVFNVLATAPCAWKVGQDLGAAGATMASWLANQLNGKGVVFMDRGLIGTSVLTAAYQDANRVLDGYPGITRYYFTANATPNLESQGVSALLSAHSNVAGILTFGFGNYAMDALAKAGHKVVPTAGYSVNATLLDCVKYKVACGDIDGPAWFSGVAMAYAIDIADKQITGSPREFYVPVTWMTNTPSLKYTSKLGPALSIGDNVLQGKNGNISLPLSLPWQTFTPEQLGF